MTSLFELHPHQADALDQLRCSLRAGSRRPVLQAPTGFGKTVVAAHIVHGVRQRGKRIAFCVPTLGLVDQTFERFVANGIPAGDMGVIQADHPWRRPAAPVQIATAQTLNRRTFPEVDVVVVDECHVRFDVYERWMQACPQVTFVGLSATPWSKGLGQQYDDLIQSISLADLIERGYLSPFRVFAPSKPDLKGVRTVAGDYHEGDLAERCNKAELVADIVKTWLDKAEGRPTLCFATGRDHARALHDRFEAHGVPVAYVDANTPRDEREEIGRQLGTGAIKVACNIGTLTTGIDWDVRCLILARPTKSKILYCQIIGRALRTADGKVDALILDHSDTTERLGFVTDIHVDELDDGTKPKQAEAVAKEAPLPRCCPSCAALMPAASKTCSECGHGFVKPAIMGEAQGELVEVAPRKRDTVKEGLVKQGKQSIYSQLLDIRQSRGRKPGWVANTYRDIFGVWPRGLMDAPIPASMELVSYCRHKDIRFAKGHGGGHVSA